MDQAFGPPMQLRNPSPFARFGSSTVAASRMPYTHPSALSLTKVYEPPVSAVHRHRTVGVVDTVVCSPQPR